MKRLILAVLACLVLPFAAEAQKPTLDSFATATGAIPIGSSKTLQFGGDTTLARTAANFMGVRNGTTAQFFSVYKTFTDSSNYRSIEVDTGNSRIITNWGGTGTAHDLILGSGASHWSIAASTGHLTSVLGTSDIRWGTTSSFPMIRPNGAALNFKLADNSGDANITAGAGTFSGTVQTAGTFRAGSASILNLTSDGQATFTNSAGNGWTSINLRIDGSGNNIRILQGAGTPEGSITARVGSLYMRNDGGANTTFCVKESGTGNTGWVCK